MGPLVVLVLSRRRWNISMKCSGSAASVSRYMKAHQMLDQCIHIFVSLITGDLNSLIHIWTNMY